MSEVKTVTNKQYKMPFKRFLITQRIAKTKILTKNN